MEAARSLLAEHPGREPSTRELYEAAGVAPPTLYHHFGTKDGLLDAVVEQAFCCYLERKRGVPLTGDLLIDFAAGWDVHIGFGVENPVLYALMYGRGDGRHSQAARAAEAELRRGLEQLADAGLLRIGVEEAVAVTTAMAIGCVTQLNHDGGSAAGPVARSMRSALISELTGHSPEPNDTGQAARLVLARLGSAPGLFTPAEQALLRQWLHTLAEQAGPKPSDAGRGVAMPELRQAARGTTRKLTSFTHEEFVATHPLGGQDRVPRLGYGAMQLAGPGVIGLPEDVAGAIEVLRRAADLGVRFFDTANAYGPRTVNQIIGRALSPFADDIVIGNKVGARRDPAGGWLTDSRPETVRTQVEDALLDMRAESSPLTYLRLPGDSQAPGNAPPEEVPLEDALGALTELRDQGKIRHIGLSGASPGMLERAQRVTPIAAVQNRFNLIDRSGIEVLAACERDGIAFVPFFPLAVGFLGELGALTRPAQRLGVSTSAVALAWLLRRSPVMVPIPGTKSLEHLCDNIGATEVAAQLTADEVRALTEVEDEESATLSTMPAQMAGALGRRRRESAGRPQPAVER